MYSRSILAGVLMIAFECSGSVLFSSSLALPMSGFIGLLLLIIPISLFMLYINIRIQQQEEITRESGRQIRRAVEVHATTMAHRYDTTIEQVTELNIELNRRVYR